MTVRNDHWLALDIGGANVKAAHDSGLCLIRPFALWREPDALPQVLRDVSRGVPPFGRLVLTMTAELCDCFETKRKGVQFILDACSSAFDGLPAKVWCVDGSFRDVNEAKGQSSLVAAANWLALAEVAARLMPAGSGLLIDIGSTTTDIIPLAGGRARPRGRTDTERLRSSELVYAGVRRTPVCALAHRLPFRGRRTGLAAELFATTLDVYLTLGSIPPDPSDLATADGRPATVDSALGRLARMVGADRDGFTPEDAHRLAAAADSALLSRLGTAAARVSARASDPPAWAIVAGSGEFLARRLALRLLPDGAPVLSLRKLWGPPASDAACARAVLILAREASETGAREGPGR